MFAVRLSEWLAQACAVRPEEGRRTLLAAGLYFLFVAHVVMVKSATNALFLSRHDPRQLPVLYILVALLVAIVVLFASHLMADPRRRRLRVLVLTAVAGVYLLGWLALHLEILPVSPVLYLFAEVSTTALNIQFWAVAGDIFDPQEGKRVFGVISGVGMAGSVCSGFFVHHAGLLLGTVNLLLAAVLVLSICVLLASRLNRYRGRSDLVPQHESTGFYQGMKYVFFTNYPRLFGGLMLLSAVLTSLVDYFFRTSARKFLSEDGLASLFGDLNVYVGALSVITMLFFSGRILQRAGIFYYLIMVPLILLVTSVCSIASSDFIFVYAMKVIESAGSLSINQAGLQLLYNPVPTPLRASVRGVIDGFLRKSGYAVGGLLLLAVASRLPGPYYQLLVVALIIVYTAVLLRLRRLYVLALDERIRVGTPEKAEINVEDASTQRVLLQALASNDPQYQLTALSLLKDTRTVDLEPYLPRLLFCNQQQVQLAAIEAVVAKRYRSQSLNLLALLNQGERRVRAAAMRALLALDPEGACRIAEPLLQSTDPGLVAVAIEALLLQRGLNPENPALQTLEKLLELGSSAPPGTRRELARLLGRLGECPYSDRLLQYLNDPDFSVQRIAATSAENLYRPSFVPRLLEMLSQRETRKEARQTLASWGDRIIDVLEQWLNDRERSLEIRLRLPRLIRMIGTQRAAEVLLFSNIQDDAFLRYRIVLALSGMRSNPNIRFNRQWTLEAVERRLESYRYYRPIYQRLRTFLAPDVIVLRALWERLEQNLEIIFRLLGLIYPHRTMMNVFYKLQSRHQPDWADALELLENILEREMRQSLFPLLETHRHLCQLPENESILPLDREAQATLEELSSSRDNLLRAAAVFTRVRLGEDCANLMPELTPGKDSMNQMEIVLFLKSVNIFRQNNLDDLVALAAITKERTFQPGEYILRQGEPGEALYIITSGRVEIQKKGRRILEVGEKSSLGSVSLLDQKPHAADAVALTETHTLMIDRTDFMDLVSDRVELLRGIFLALTDRLRALLAVTEEGGLAEDGMRDGPTNPV